MCISVIGYIVTSEGDDGVVCGILCMVKKLY